MSKKDRLAKVGIKATKIYLIVLVTLIPALATIGLLKIEPIGLNELGDFLAGAFGPLAIFWLILGFFQQGEELRNSVATLELQAKELANSVEQQRELVLANREALDHEKALAQSSEIYRKNNLQPKFFPTFSSWMSTGNKFAYIIIIENAGGPAANVEYDVQACTDNCLILSGRATMHKNGERIENRSSAKIPKIASDLLLRISYKDSEGDDFLSAFCIQLLEDDRFSVSPLSTIPRPSE
ncbi:hypothetical protein Q4543_18260 [Salipiger sp. 1_MG-2023]|uniref:hypothetical protein n=1 Tax=Salipiger sp. 1_MG-2023 TaxID=3062665 RepID=UPI0026E48181|nr:hypothetical protein [Salipiger sp. 1_MG-2023]MDO6587460.1 hypothetical protein [Salipiger sp. 1_MG-2023]